MGIHTINDSVGNNMHYCEFGIDLVNTAGSVLSCEPAGYAWSRVQSWWHPRRLRRGTCFTLPLNCDSATERVPTTTTSIPECSCSIVAVENICDSHASPATGQKNAQQNKAFESMKPFSSSNTCVRKPRFQASLGGATEVEARSCHEKNWFALHTAHRVSSMV